MLEKSFGEGREEKFVIKKNEKKIVISFFIITAMFFLLDFLFKCEGGMMVLYAVTVPLCFAIYLDSFPFNIVERKRSARHCKKLTEQEEEKKKLKRECWKNI